VTIKLVGTETSFEIRDAVNDLGDITTLNWSYDNLNRLISETREAEDGSESYIDVYSYDLTGNRLAKLSDTDATSQAIEGYLADPTIFHADRTITYAYDDNDWLLTDSLDSNDDGDIDTTTVYAYGTNNAGTEQTGKTEWQGTNTNPSTGTKLSSTTYHFNLQGMMDKVEMFTGASATPHTTITYAYDDNGIRVEQKIDDGTNVTTHSYVIDHDNLTGYAQVLEEYVNAVRSITYTIGLDVITQTAPAVGVTLPTGVSAHDPLTFLYDGHGSTRALLDAAITVVERFAYDAYGIELRRYLKIMKAA
jgi:hypothetical protein